MSALLGEFGFSERLMAFFELLLELDGHYLF